MASSGNQWGWKSRPGQYLSNLSLLVKLRNCIWRPTELSARASANTTLRSQDYWSGYNVMGHRIFKSKQESLTYFHWRTEQYIDYLKYMPVAGHDGEIVLDYGCGPGHDLVGFVEYSRPLRLIGMDVSKPSLDQAAHRLGLHGAVPELVHIDEDTARLPLSDAAVDYIHCSGVLHHVPDPVKVLREFRRILKADGCVRIMVYNYNCVWLHLFAAYTVRFTQSSGQGLSVKEAFKRSTDTAACPISHAWLADDVAELCLQSGFRSEHLGNAMSVRELAILQDRFEAVLVPDLEVEHRRFLLGLTFDNRGVPYFEGQVAGIDACYLLRPL